MNVWYTARGAGLGALLAFSLATALGAITSVKTANPANRVVLQYTHRAAAALGLGLIALHVSMILADADAHVGVVGVIVPLQSGYRPASVALGTLALYTLIVVAALGAARGRLATSTRATRAWRGVHLFAYVGWALAMLHGYTAGTDAGVGWVDLLYLGCLALVLAALVIRLVDVAHGAEIRRAMEPVR